MVFPLCVLTYARNIQILVSSRILWTQLWFEKLSSPVFLFVYHLDPTFHCLQAVNLITDCYLKGRPSSAEQHGLTAFHVISGKDIET